MMFNSRAFKITPVVQAHDAGKRVFITQEFVQMLRGIMVDVAQISACGTVALMKVPGPYTEREQILVDALKMVSEIPEVTN